MFSDYKAAIVKDYHLKKADGTLSLNLMNPTPAGLKNESLIVLETRTKKEDFKTLRLFFGEKENEGDYEKTIRNTDIDKFRPLSNFLKGKTSNPDERNIELLAWLIDFSPRPYRLEFSASDNKVATLPTTRNEHQVAQVLSAEHTKMIYGGYSTAESAQQITVSEKPDRSLLHRLLNNKRRIFILLIVALTGALGISLNKSRINNTLSAFSNAEKQCMYWSGEHFIQVDCLSQQPNIDLIAIDRSKLDYFRKINRPDTLTERHVNKVWYLKTNNMLELFTMEGKHPEHPEKRLRPLSRYMYNKYVATGKVKVD